MSKTMRAVVFKGPHRVALGDRPVPSIQEAGDVIVEVNYSALCGRSVPLCSQSIPSRAS